MSLGDFDYKVMLWIRDADFCTMDILVEKFGLSVRGTVESLCKDKLLYWEHPADNLFGHDDSLNRIRILPAGERELNNFVESVRLTGKDKWKERFLGFVGGIVSGVAVTLLSAWLLDLLHL